MTPPKCRVCGAAHWSRQPHVLAKQELVELGFIRFHGFVPGAKTAKALPKLPKRGRPKKPDALTPAQKQQAYRDRKKAHRKGTDPLTGRPRQPRKV